MKNKISLKVLLIAFTLFSSVSIYSQSHKMALSVTGGYVDGGFGGLAMLDFKVNEFDYIQVNAQANFTKIEYQGIKIPVNLYALNTGFFFDVLRNNKRNFALALGGGIQVGSEVVNGGDKMLENNLELDFEPSNIVFGAFVGMDADIFLIPTVAINVKLQEVYHFNSEIGELTPYFGLGFKLILK